MKLVLKNIGGLKDKHEFEFKKGINRITAPNAAGKTSLVRGIQCLISSDAALLAKTLNIDSNSGYIKLDGYVRNLERISNSKVEAVPIEDYTFIDKNSNWRHADKIVFFTPESLVVEEIGQDIFRVGRYIEKISDAELLRGDIYRKEQRLLEKKSELNQYINNLKRAQELEGEIDNFKGELEKLIEEEHKLEKEVDEESGSELTVIGGDLDNIKREIRDIIEKLRRKESEVSRLRKQYDDARSRYESLKQEFDWFEKKYPNPEDKLEQLKEEMRPHEDKKAVLNRDKNNLSEIRTLLDKAIDKFEEKEGKCPICTSKTSYDFLKKRQEELRNNIAKLAADIKFENEQIKQIKDKRDELAKWIDKRKSQLQQLNELNAKIQTYEKELQNRKNIVDEIDEKIKELTIENERLEQEYEKVQDALESDKKDKLKKIRKEIGGFEAKIEDRKKQIEKLVSSIPDYSIGESLEEYARRKETILNSLENEIETLKKKFISIMFGAIEKFNNTIKDVYKEMGFTNFRNIMIPIPPHEELESLDVREAWNLLESLDIVVELESGKKEPLNFLSKSEQLTLGLVLQVSARENYIPDFPFFVIDESTNSYDSDRLNSIVKYLSDKAEYVLLSQLVPVGEQKDIVIKYDYPTSS